MNGYWVSSEKKNIVEQYNTKGLFLCFTSKKFKRIAHFFIKLINRNTDKYNKKN